MSNYGLSQHDFVLAFFFCRQLGEGFEENLGSPHFYAGCYVPCLNARTDVMNWCYLLVTS